MAAEDTGWPMDPQGSASAGVSTAEWDWRVPQGPALGLQPSRHSSQRVKSVWAATFLGCGPCGGAHLSQIFSTFGETGNGALTGGPPTAGRPKRRASGAVRRTE